MISWISFEWKTSSLSTLEVSIAPLIVRVAEESEEQTVARAIFSAFLLDAAWSDVSAALKRKLEASVKMAFVPSPSSCLVLIHGNRIIGASAVDVDPQAENHLLTGPCILHEYRNRGLGTYLLHASLLHLKQESVDVVRGITRTNSITARFLYPKFESSVQACSFDPLQIK